jgi:hypothetical protein
VVALVIDQELYAHVGWRIAPDFHHAALDWFLKAPGDQDQVSDPDVPVLVSHHGLLPNVL